MEDFLRVVSALNDESRVRVLAFLIVHRSSCVCELEASLGMAQSTLSRHLKILKDGGFLRIKKVGARSYYELFFASKTQAAFAAEIEALRLRLPQKVDADNATRCQILGK